MKHIKLFEPFFEAKKEEKEEKGGLTAKQKKLPKALQDAILKKAGKAPKKEDSKKEDSKKEDSKKEEVKDTKGL